jgi:hypothetical protein
VSEDTWKRYRNLMGRFQSARSGAHRAPATGAQLVRAFSSPFLFLISMVMSVSSSAVPVVMPSPHADPLPPPPLSPLSPQFGLLLGFLIIIAAATVIIALRCDHIRGCGAKAAPQFDAASARSRCRHHCCNQSSGKSVSTAGTTAFAFASSNGSDSDGMPVLQNLSDSDSDFDGDEPRGFDCSPVLRSAAADGLPPPLHRPCQLLPRRQMSTQSVLGGQ